MGLKADMSREEIIEFIDGDLLPQARTEIKNWIWPRKKTGGYFVVSRQILCMVDFLGAVYCGYNQEEQAKDVEGRKISVGGKARKFILDFFEPNFEYTSPIVDLFYDMYRNGLVHLYQPKILKYKGGTLQWCIYKGKRNLNELILNKVVFKNVSHMQIVPDEPKETNYLLICIDSLYEDFEKALTTYRDQLSQSEKLQQNWRETVNAISQPR
jgi:hypothetical protein